MKVFLQEVYPREQHQRCNQQNNNRLKSLMKYQNCHQQECKHQWYMFYLQCLHQPLSNIK